MSVRFCAFGNLDSGKTISCVEEALRYRRDFPNNPIWSNIDLPTLPYTKIDSAAILFYRHRDMTLSARQNWFEQYAIKL